MMTLSKSNVKLPFRKSHAFIIGIDNYANVRPLDTPINDAKVLASKLKTNHDYQNPTILLDPTLQDLRELLHKAIPQEVTSEEDRLLFYFAGHGVALDGENGPSGYIVPADARPNDRDSLLPMEELHDALTSLRCRHGLLILDCCFSGAFKWASGFRGFQLDIPHIIYRERFQRYCLDPAWHVLSSSAYDQKALDVLNEYSLGYRNTEHSEHSPFALALFEALDGKADVVPDGGDGLITASELYIYLRDWVETRTMKQDQRQTPSFFPLKRHDKGEFIFLTPSHPLNLKKRPNRNPYKGLYAYGDNDALLFYGRDRVIKELLKVIGNTNFVVVRGASGVGKSSLVKAGIIPQLKRRNWSISPIVRPGKSPMLNLKNSIEKIDSQFNCILFVDQFEELLTQSLSQEDSQNFQRELLQLTSTYPNLKIIISIRSDFEPQFERGILKDLWNKGAYSVPNFSTAELREIVIKPAVQEVLIFEPKSLVSQIIDDVNQAPGTIPLLSFTLSELYHKYLKGGRNDRALTQDDYDDLGGVIGSLRTCAEGVYESLDEAHKQSMRRIMLRMVSLEGGEIAGKRVYLDELKFSLQEENGRIKKVLESLVEARLIVMNLDLSDRTFVEPAHDALVRAWALLWEWVRNSGEERIMLQNKLGQAVEDYKKENDNKKLLWDQDPRLDLLIAKNNSKNFWLNESESKFINRSIKRRQKRRRQFISGLVAVIIGLSALSGVAIRQSTVARNNEDIANDNANKEREQRKIAEDNLIRAYNFQIGVLEAERNEEERRQGLAENAELRDAVLFHQKNARRKQYQIDSIRGLIMDMDSARNAKLSIEEKVENN